MRVFIKDKQISHVVNSPKSEDYGGIFRTTNADLAYIGTAPNVDTGMRSCVRDVEYNGRRIGLWDFLTTSGDCVGCIRCIHSYGMV